MNKSANSRQSVSGETDKSQSERFIEAARELGCDESEERFDEALKKVAKHRPKDEEPSNRKPQKRG